MIAVRYALIVLAGVCFGTILATGIVNGLVLIMLIALGGAAATSVRVRALVRSLIADDTSDELSMLDVLDRRGRHRDQ